MRCFCFKPKFEKDSEMEMMHKEFFKLAFLSKLQQIDPEELQQECKIFEAEFEEYFENAADCIDFLMQYHEEFYVTKF